MPINLWDKEYNRIYKDFVREYLDDGYSLDEAERNAKRDAKEMMKDQLDFVEDLWDKSFKDLE
jgi:hypothetical protein|tara:strand:+ start:167 stop:355 length:189 start_codon:yes stop_codon:yes gene_type:complete